MTLWQKITGAFFIVASVLVALFQAGRKWQKQDNRRKDAERAAKLYQNRPKGDDEVEYRD